MGDDKNSDKRVPIKPAPPVQLRPKLDHIIKKGAGDGRETAAAEPDTSRHG